MAERMYKCKYGHCIHPEEKIPASEVVMVGKNRYHKDCAETREKVEIAKRIYFDHIDDKADYVQTLAVLNNLIFDKKLGVDYIIFVLKYLVAFGGKVKSPYVLHHVAEKNKIVQEKWADERKRRDVLDRFDYRTKGN